MYTAVLLLYSTSRFVLFLGFCQSLQHNPRWPRYACYLWCVSQHCQSGATRSGWEGTDSTGAQKRINQSLPSSPSSYCCWLSSKFSCRRRKTEENFWMNQIIHLTEILSSVSSFFFELIALETLWNGKILLVCVFDLWDTELSLALHKCNDWKIMKVLYLWQAAVICLAYWTQVFLIFWCTSFSAVWSPESLIPSTWGKWGWSEGM